MKPVSIFILIGASFLFFASVSYSEDRQKHNFSHYKALHYQKLDQAREGRKRQLISYLSDVQQKAGKIKTDALTLSFFKTIYAFQAVKHIADLPGAVVRKTEQLQRLYFSHFISKYHAFHDLLFIDAEGTVFYSIRKQIDHHKNIFNGQLKDTALSKKMKTLPATSFVDFQFFAISGEPSAFFIEPVKTEKGHIGWVVLQFSINKINNMFCLAEEIGDTHEVFLVNSDHYMLTDSRFIAESTILKERLATENIVAKFNAGKGRKEVTDYRGHRVISSFEVFDFLGSEWLIISKMDEEELISNYFRHHPEKLLNNIEKVLSLQTHLYRKGHLNIDSGIEVNMDEFRRNEGEQLLYTHGVSTCTAFVAKKPGAFTYFAHISPFDRVYGENRTDLIAHILKKIEYLEVTELEKHELCFYIISPNRDAFPEIIKKLTAHGYFLSQIKIIHCSQAVHANVSSRNCRKGVTVNWKINDDLSFLENSYERENLQSLFLKTL